MRNLKLFPKTFLYAFSLMAAIALISHALFYFVMPVVYTGQKEKSFQTVCQQLTQTLESAPADRFESIVTQYALRYRLGVFVNYEGKLYNLMTDGALSAGGNGSHQETTDSVWLIPSGETNPDLSHLREDFYVKTDSLLTAGASFDTEDGKSCYLLLLSTLQPVSEAKEAVLVFLPLTLLLSLLLSVLFALLYSGKITKPLTHISEITERMKALDPRAECRVKARDEIGTLSENVNTLYQSLLSTIDSLQKENARVSQAEAGKVDFLRAASHELKTPVTALLGMLDNMIMGIGRYKDWETYLPVCRDMVQRFGGMIQEILDASRLNLSFEQEAREERMVGPFAEKALSPYRLIAKSRGVLLNTDLSADFSASFPANAMEKALSNILSNAVKYTAPSGKVTVRLQGRSILIENECEPIPENMLPHLFEPFYRPDYSRSRNLHGENPQGGNGLGLYITAKILNTLGFPFSFEPCHGTENKEEHGMRFTISFP